MNVLEIFDRCPLLLPLLYGTRVALDSETGDVVAVALTVHELWDRCEGRDVRCFWMPRDASGEIEEIEEIDPSTITLRRKS